MSDTNERSVASAGSAGERGVLCDECDGANIRDTFAAAALTGLLVLNKPGHGQQTPDEIIRRAWRWADAMLQQRNTQQPETTLGKCSVRNGAPSGCETVRSVPQPVAWAAMRHGEVWEVSHHPIYLSCDIHRIAPLYLQPQPTLTDEERKAIHTAMSAYGENNGDAECAQIETTLWKLLERTK